MDRILEPFQYVDAIKNLAPGAKFGIYDNDLTRIDWQDESKSQPSDADIEAELVRLQEEYDAQAYARNRKAEYNALNQLEMQFDDKEDGTTTWEDAIEVIKAKWPKDNSGPV